MAQLMPLPLTVSCFSKIQIGFTFWVPADLGSPGKRPLNGVCVCVCVCVYSACIHSTNEVEAIQEVQILSLSGFVVGIIFIAGDFYQL